LVPVLLMLLDEMTRNPPPERRKDWNQKTRERIVDLEWKWQQKQVETFREERRDKCAKTVQKPKR
jgi:hypothetical protein